MEIFLTVYLVGLASADVILNTKSGPVRATIGLSEDVNAFLGIPFAEPPVEELRFAKPVPKSPWKDIYNATNLPRPCPQLSVGSYYFLPDVSNMSEDCLYLNLWIPKSKYIQGLRPVVIFIHGGAFNTGSTNAKVYDGTKLASRGDLIVATINYRVGILGFFLGHIKEAPGNMGIYDQIMAIKWIKDNAGIFGGDPDNIVLMGESAGAFSISVHMVSPLSQNLFKKAIIQSGSSVNPYMFDENARLDRNSQTIASIIGCTNKTVNLKTNPHSVVECLKRKPVEDIVKAESILLKTNPITFYPSVNNDVLPNSTVQFRDGKFRKDVNVLIGINRDEGTLMLTLGIPEYFGYYGQQRVETITKNRAVMLARGEILLTKQPNASEIVDSYMKQVKKRNSGGYTKMLADIVGDFVIACPTLFLADFLSLKGNPVYFYKFEIRAASTPMAEWVGVTHMDDLQYVFGNPFHDNFTDEEVEISNLLMDRWAAFARTGNPNIPGHIPWLRYSYHNRLYLNFGQEEETIRKDPISRCEIWRKRFKSDFDPPLIRFLRNSGMNNANDD